MSAPRLTPHAHVVGKLGSDGQWRVLLMVPLPDGADMIEHELDVDAAEKLARGLLDYAKLVRERRGLPPA